MVSPTSGANTTYFAMAYNEQKEPYKKRVQKFLEDHGFGSNENWNVYAFVNENRHAGLIFETSAETKSFTIELRIDHKKTPKEIIMGIKVMDETSIPKEKKIPLGPIQKQATDIFLTAYEELVKIGPYNLFTSNCQNYAKELAKALGVRKEYETDIEKIASTGSDIALPTLLMYIIDDTPSPSL